jgi:uncharacterized damage-inducible protein DinB
MRSNSKKRAIALLFGRIGDKLQKMLAMLQDLVDHKNYANAVLVSAIAEHEPASTDPEVLHLLHHIILANRFWVALFQGQPFDIDDESKVPESLGGVAALYRETQEREIQWMNGIHEHDLDRVVATAFLPDRTLALAQALMQVCLHSHGHRAQCAARLRALGGNPPPTDFIVWLEHRPAPNWSE